ncbi:MarR family transcriptional regulator [Streptomyces sp. G3]|uniref:MarR family winged helix-turn-helix transcriptional regulator n=1 Tax=Streptomyces sp. NPDC093681 TaxID=3155202 RepID=UPI0020309126|nr:MarR family transcriptional regulator [Streptomyces sp. G3]MCM1943613.1 MarR family transcriptional regulator [Streptomyces sp. G3]
MSQTQDPLVKSPVGDLGVPVDQGRAPRNSFVTAQSMADMVRGLESRGLVRREPNPGNRREKVILLADAGRRLLAEYAEPARMLEQRMVADLDPADVERFRDALRSAYRALS